MYHATGTCVRQVGVCMGWERCLAGAFPPRGLSCAASVCWLQSSLVLAVLLHDS